MEDVDAEQLLAPFFAHHNIDLGDFELIRYFPAVGLCLFGFWSRTPAPIPLTLGMVL